MHHPDYDQPLLVIWLCRKHHKRHHQDEGPDPTICPSCRVNKKGVSGYCAACQRARNRVWMQKERQKGRYQQTEAENRLRAAKAYARYYLNKGLIDRKSCEIEGCEESPQMHIEDISRPLKLRWLCRYHRHMRKPTV